MKRSHIIVAIIAVAGLTAVAVFPWLARAKAYSGPGIYGNLRSLQLAKDLWLADGNTNEWPTEQDLFGSWWTNKTFTSAGKTFNERMRPKYGELYFINRTGAPPFAYFPKAGGQYSAGDIVVLTSNGLMKVRQ